METLKRLKSDYTYITGLLSILNYTKDVTPDSDNLVPDDLERVVDTYPNNVAIIFEDYSWTYTQLEQKANRFANWAQNKGIGRDDCVALFMGNCPDYLAIWMGIIKLGARVALLNNQLIAQPLAHCIDIVDAKLMITEREHWSQYEEAKACIQTDMPVWVLDDASLGQGDLKAELAQTSFERPKRSLREGMTASDVALYIYTSGTTGLPKAARMTHARCQNMMRAIVPASEASPEDRVMITLPLYHATGGLAAVGNTVMKGGAIVLERKFSPSKFWQTAKRTGATSFVYIGEMCRYLMNCDPNPAERDHSVRKCFGNGLRADVWKELVDRTGIERVNEFYGSTEGNVNFINLDSKIGAMGRIPDLIKHRLPTRLVKINLETEDVIRHTTGPKAGLCIESEIDEPGEALGKIDPSSSRGRFEGYRDKEDTQKKILTDVFEKGDMYFRTGDLMRRDKLGYFYFVDRLGDTYRWKAENVSTNEVSEALSSFDGVELANVYGVPVPGQEGKAGMAALQIAGELDFKAFWGHIEKVLPDYARPVFVRILRRDRTTGTFKFKKIELVEEGFDPHIISAPLFVTSNVQKTFEPLTQEVFQDIVNGQRRL